MFQSTHYSPPLPKIVTTIYCGFSMAWCINRISNKQNITSSFSGSPRLPAPAYWNSAFGLGEGEVEKDEEGIMTMKVPGENMAWLLKKTTWLSLTR